MWFIRLICKNQGLPVHFPAKYDGEDFMAEQAYTGRKGLTVKDLVTTGIFSALLCLTIFIGGVPFGANPILTFYAYFCAGRFLFV
jgi:hypothetical protein